MTLMTSWAVVCDVHFLEPQHKQADETPHQFAERVQHLIARKAKLKVAPWDGYLKYYNLGKKASMLCCTAQQAFYMFLASPLDLFLLEATAICEAMLF